MLLRQMVSSTQCEDIHFSSEKFWCADGHWSYWNSHLSAMENWVSKGTSEPAVSICIIYIRENQKT